MCVCVWGLDWLWREWLILGAATAVCKSWSWWFDSTNVRRNGVRTWFIQCVSTAYFVYKLAARYVFSVVLGYAKRGISNLQ